MVLSVEPIYHALESIKNKGAHKILLSPQGKKYNQEEAKRLVNKDEIVLICGHYEGFDERVRELVDEEISIGDFVLTGGEIAAMAIIDSISRMIPGVLGSDESFVHDSFYTDSLDYYVDLDSTKIRHVHDSTITKHGEYLGASASESP